MSGSDPGLRTAVMLTVNGRRMVPPAGRHNHRPMDLSMGIGPSSLRQLFFRRSFYAVVDCVEGAPEG